MLQDRKILPMSRQPSGSATGVAWCMLIVFCILSGTAIHSQANDGTTADDENADSPFYFGGFMRAGMMGIREDDSTTSDQGFFSAFPLLRLQGEYSGKAFKTEALIDNALTFANRGGREFRGQWLDLPRNRLLILEGQMQEDTYVAKSYAHRLNASWNFGPFMLKAGRQACAWGEGRLINPMNLVTPTDPFVFDTEMIPAADAVNLSWYLNDTDYVQAVVVPYRRENSKDYTKLQAEDTNAFLRLKKSLGNFELTLVAGRHFHANIGGIESSVQLGGGMLRFSSIVRREEEIVIDRIFYKEQIPGRVFYTGLLGYSYSFSGGWNVNAELLANGLSEDRASTRYQMKATEAAVVTGDLQPLAGDASFFITAGRFISRYPFFSQFSIQHEFSSLWKGSLFLIVDPEGRSLSSLPQLEYNMHENTVIIMAARLSAWRDISSEFQKMQQSVYAFVRWYW